MTTKQPTTGPASISDLYGLWRAILALLVRTLARPKVSIAMLQEARRFLEQSGYVNPGRTTASTQKELSKLERLYGEALIAAMQAKPSAAVLMEAKAWRAHLEGLQAADRARTGITGTDLVPFKTQ